MNIRLVGVSYKLPRLDGVTYRLPKMTDVELWENHRLHSIKDTVSVSDYVRILTDIGVADSAIAFSECLIARPPFEEVITAHEVFTMAVQYNRSLRDTIVPNSSCVFGMDKYLKDVAIVGDRISIQFDKMNSDFVGVMDNLDLFATSFVDINDAVVPAESLRFEVDKNFDESVAAIDALFKEFDDGGFFDGGQPIDAFAFELEKTFVDNATVTDFLQVLWSRSTGSLYGQSVYGGATFGG